MSDNQNAIGRIAGEIAALRAETQSMRHETLLALNRISAEIFALKLSLPPRLVAGRDVDRRDRAS